MCGHSLRIPWGAQADSGNFVKGPPASLSPALAENHRSIGHILSSTEGAAAETASKQTNERALLIWQFEI